MTASTATASVAVDAKLELDGEKYCFGRFIDQTTVERVQNHRGAICGTAHPLSHRIQPGREMVRFSFELDITAEIMDTLLPHMTVANTPATTLWPSTETLSAFDIVVQKVGAIHKYTDARIIRWAFRAQRGSLPVSLRCDCVAASETKLASYTFTEGAIGSIYTFTESDYQIDSTAYPIDRIMVMSDTNPFLQWNNSVTLTDAILTDQQTYVATSIPYTSANHLTYWNNKSSVTSREIEVSFTSGSDVLKIILPAGKYVPKSPDILSKLSEVRLPHTWQAHIDTSADPDTPAFHFDHTNA